MEKEGWIFLDWVYERSKRDRASYNKSQIIYIPLEFYDRVLEDCSTKNVKYTS
jgi:hypothetical protein